MGEWFYAVWLGAGATATVDLWAIVRRRLFGIAEPNYGLVGRWFAHMPHGRFVHDSIAHAAPVRGERLIGWAAHYLIGIGFATILLAGWGLSWLHDPTPGPALVVGISTVLAPYLVLQPGTGAGFAASRAPHPASARLQSLITHTIFGLGLYGSGWISKLLLLA